MKLLFIDETAQLGYFGLSVVCMDHTKYISIMASVLNALNKNKWSMEKEFKSTHIFSSTQGSVNVSIEARRSIAKEIIQSNISSRNARINAYFAYTKGDKSQENYEILLKTALAQIPRCYSSKGGKNLIAVFFDQLDIGNKATKGLILTLSLLGDKDYVLLEHPNFVTSSNKTHGILLADLIAYVSLWKSIKETDKSLENKPLKKIKDEFIQELFTSIKKIKINEVKKC